MFHIDTINNLAYLDSLNIKVFPSGRRKSELLNENDQKEKYHIPIDPEARLNTEANHRKHSGLNGYKQDYILDWGSDSIKLVLAGYLFNIKLSTDFRSTEDTSSCQLIGEHLAAELKDNNGNKIVDNKIYVNILTTDVTFFKSVDGSSNIESQVGTEILRDQSFSADPRTCLDLQKVNNPKLATDFYFSGLSFSAEPLYTIKPELKNSNNMHAFTLQILTKNGDVWQIYEPSRLPKLDHGDNPDSVKIPGDLAVDGDVNIDGSVTATELIVQNSDGSTTNAVTLEVITDEKVTNQLQFWTRPKP